MPTAEDLAPAVAAGIITAEQATRIAALETAPAVAAVPVPAAAAVTSVDPDEEAFHFARGFQDVFLTIGIALLLVGVAIGGSVFGNVSFGAFAGAAVAFALAWYFARVRALVLPSIALALGFTLFVGVGTAAMLGSTGWPDVFRSAYAYGDPGPIMAGGIAAALAAILFFVRYRLPFALGLIALSSTYIVAGGLALALGSNGFMDYARYTTLGLGLVIFAIAMAFDLSDPKRRTLRSDNAFWLHLVAAPLIVQGVLALFATRGGASDFAVGGSLIVIVIVAVLGVLALIIDRRALLVAGLMYVAFAVAQLFDAASVTRGSGVAATLVVVGAAVVILGAGWRPIRAFVLRFVGDGVRRRLPPEVRA